MAETHESAGATVAPIDSVCSSGVRSPLNGAENRHCLFNRKTGIDVSANEKGPPTMWAFLPPQSNEPDFPSRYQDGVRIKKPAWERRVEPNSLNRGDDFILAHGNMDCQVRMKNNAEIAAVCCSPHEYGMFFQGHSGLILMRPKQLPREGTDAGPAFAVVAAALIPAMSPHSCVVSTHHSASVVKINKAVICLHVQ